jgi:AcrR family transcriptional regulator
MTKYLIWSLRHKRKEQPVPRIFSEADRAAIREALIEAGRDHFLRYGLRKTNVAELARAAGIAKGTFYHFFESKEDLCMEIFDQEENAMREAVEAILSGEREAVEALRAVMNYAREFVRGNSLLAHLRETGEYTLLARGVGKQRLADHLSRDVDFAKMLLEALRAKGGVCNYEPEVVAGVLRAVALMLMQEHVIGEVVFQPAMDLIVTWIIEGLVGGGASR